MKDNDNKKYLPIREASASTGMGQAFLRKAFKEGLLEGYTTPAGQRRFCKDSLRKFCERSVQAQKQSEKINFIYARVSSKKQYDDLARQVTYLQEWTANSGIKYDVIEDIGSGINFKRKGLQTILDKCIKGVIGNVTVAHSDRLSRFAFDLIECIVQKAGGTITVIDDDHGNKTSEQELAEDLLSIVHIYSCRQMGKRSYTRTRDNNNKDTHDDISTNGGAESNVGSESQS